MNLLASTLHTDAIALLCITHSGKLPSTVVYKVVQVIMTQYSWYGHVKIL